MRPMQPLLLVTLLLFALLMLNGCDDDDNEATPAPTLTVVENPALNAAASHAGSRREW